MEGETLFSFLAPTSEFSRFDGRDDRKGALSRILSRCFGNAYWNFVRRSVRVGESAWRREGERRSARARFLGF